MSKNLLDCYGFCGIMNAAVRQHGSAAKLARALGVDEQALRDTRSLKSLDDAVVKALGFMRVLRYPSLTDAKTIASKKQIQEKLTNFVRECGSQRAAAARMGIDEKLLSKIQNADRGFGAVLSFLGYGKPLNYFYPLARNENHG
ncbi:hypothetical protein [Acetobacter sp.]|uniref:hypothetical protein n=1 Tax=Acetobacter sp. TaxID=440 RepID=UPI0039EA517A